MFACDLHSSSDLEILPLQIFTVSVTVAVFPEEKKIADAKYLVATQYAANSSFTAAKISFSSFEF